MPIKKKKNLGTFKFFENENFDVCEPACAKKFWNWTYKMIPVGYLTCSVRSKKMSTLHPNMYSMYIVQCTVCVVKRLLQM